MTRRELLDIIREDADERGWVTVAGFIVEASVLVLMVGALWAIAIYCWATQP